MKLKVLEWVTCSLTLLGSILLSTNTFLSPYAFIIMMATNVLFVYLFINTKQIPLVLLNVAFIIIHGVGIYRWLIA